jgi:hypothetical protein
MIIAQHLQCGATSITCSDSPGGTADGKSFQSSRRDYAVTRSLSQHCKCWAILAPSLSGRNYAGRCIILWSYGPYRNGTQASRFSVTMV